jgi:hypothetical protein
MREIYAGLCLLLGALTSTLTASAAPTNFAPPPPPDLPAGVVANILATRACDHVELSPDKLWVAASRTYSAPAQGHIWDDGVGHSCIVVREVDDQELGSDFLYWDAPSLKIEKIA